MENNFNKNANCIFYANYFKSTVGEIAMKLCYFNTFQHFQILLQVIEKHSKVEISLRRRWKKKLSRLACLLGSSWVRFTFDNQILTRWKQTQWVRTNWVCILAHSFDSLCFPGCSWKNAVQRKCLLLAPDAFPSHCIWGHTETNTNNVLRHVLTSHSGITQ